MSDYQKACLYMVNVMNIPFNRVIRIKTETIIMLWIASKI